MYSDVENRAFAAKMQSLFLKSLNDKNPNKNNDKIENNQGKNRMAISFAPKIK